MGVREGPDSAADCALGFGLMECCRMKIELESVFSFASALALGVQLWM